MNWIRKEPVVPGGVQPAMLHLGRSVLIFLIANFLVATIATAQFASNPGTAAVVVTDQVRATLLAHAPEGVVPGKPLWLGLQIEHKPEWHTYWKNPGDSGLPITLEWSLPTGASAGDIAWPIPKKIPIGDLANYGYEGTVLLPVPVTIASHFKPDGVLSPGLAVKLKASWLVCRKECIPEEGDFSLTVPTASATGLHGAAFEAALKSAPRPIAPVVPGASPPSQIRIEGDALTLAVRNLPVSLRGQTLELFPETPEVLQPAAPWTQSWDGAVWSARVPLSPQRSASPSDMPVVLVGMVDGVRTGFRSDLPVLGAWPTTAAATGVPPALAQALERNAATPAAPGPLALGALLLAMGAALLGGLILNLMPCVFPVLALKVLGFAADGQQPQRLRANGLAYSAGVLVSFLSLAGLMLGLRAAGEAVGWGFQLQSPTVVAALAALFTLIGLNLVGVFEVGHVLPSRLASLQARHPAADAALTGVLAVAVASPCTAPFMGASLGLTANLPASQTLLIFTALALGFALPYLGASFVPGLARALPRPGVWMDTLRRFMAFPMFATVVWLVWVLGQQSGIDGAAALLALLVALALCVWALSTAASMRPWIATVSVAIFAMMAIAMGPFVVRMTDSGPVQADTGSLWQAWAPGKVEQHLAQGQPVFVDFTAAWCVTCQFVKKTTLADAQVLADFKQRQVVLLRADWTRRDPAITSALAQLGRSGVPVYVLHTKKDSPPMVLSELPGVEEVRLALSRL